MSCDAAGLVMVKDTVSPLAETSPTVISIPSSLTSGAKCDEARKGALAVIFPLSKFSTLSTSRAAATMPPASQFRRGAGVVSYDDRKRRLAGLLSKRRVESHAMAAARRLFLGDFRAERLADFLATAYCWVIWIKDAPAPSDLNLTPWLWIGPCSADLIRPGGYGAWPKPPTPQAELPLLSTEPRSVGVDKR